MTTTMKGKQVFDMLKGKLASAIVEVQGECLVVKPAKLTEVAGFIKHTQGLEFDYLSSVTGIDYPDYFEVVYLFYSLEKNHRFTLRVRCTDKADPVVPSLTCLWMGADLQEREIYDLLGIKFSGHPLLKRIFMWEGFEGHPLRKDFKNGF